MTLFYVIVSYFLGVISSLVVVFLHLWAGRMEKEFLSPPEEEMKAQFIDPEPLKDKLVDGKTLQEIIE